MNDFDFYAFVIDLGTAPKRNAKKFGLPATMQLESTKTMVRYGSKVFPRYSYTATVDFMDAVGASREKVDAQIAALEAKYGTPVHARYFARD